MKIILLGYVHGEGGIQTHTLYLSKGLRKRGHSVTIVSPLPMLAHRDNAVTKAVSSNIIIYSNLLDLVASIRSRDPDAVVIAGTGFKAMVGALATRRKCRRVFFEVMSGARNNLIDPRMLANFGFDAIVGQGLPVTTRFVREFNWRGIVETIPALPEPLELHCDIPSKPISKNVKNGISFVHFGRLAKHKNVSLLIDRFKDYAPPNSSLDIWGDGPALDCLKDQIQKCGLTSSIRLRGRYPSGIDYINLLQSYDVKLLPTIGEEGAPLVLLEAMACGLPFVANGVGGIPDYENQDCAITNGDIGNFIPAVKRMVERIVRGDINSNRLQGHYLEKFSFEQLTSRWETFLENLVNSDRNISIT